MLLVKQDAQLTIVTQSKPKLLKANAYHKYNIIN
jgi:hypothetical protein